MRMIVMFKTKDGNNDTVLSNLFSPARRFRTSRLEAAAKGEVALEVLS